MAYEGTTQKEKPVILKFLRPREQQEWTNIGLQIAKDSRELSSQYFSKIPEGLDSLIAPEHQRFFQALRLISSSDILKAFQFYQKSPEKLLKLNPNIRDKILTLAITLSCGEADTLIQIFNDYISSLSTLGNPAQEQIVSHAEEIGRVSFDAVQAFLFNARLIASEMNEFFLTCWVNQGLKILRKDRKSGVDYFSMQGKQGATEFNRWVNAVAFEDVKGILSVFATGLCGKKMLFEEVEQKKKQHRFFSIYMTGNKRKVLLPPYYSLGRTKKENFNLYKIAVAYQVGYIEFGTFNSGFEIIWEELSKSKLSNLAKDIFLIIEDGRIGCLLNKQYRGLRHHLEQSLLIELKNRKAFFNNQETVALETLLRITLDSFDDKKGLSEIEHIYQPLQRAMTGFYQEAESSWDSFLKAKEVYRIFEALAEKDKPFQDRSLRSSEERDMPEVPVPGISKKDSKESVEGETGPDNEDSLVPLKKLVKNLKLKNDTHGRPITDTNGFQSTDNEDLTPEEVFTEKYCLPTSGSGSVECENIFYYDEWDYIQGKYRNKWCRAIENTTTPGFLDRYNKIKEQYNFLIHKVKKQFQRIKPVVMETVKRVEWGDDLDLDEVIKWAVDRKQRKSPSEKLFIKKEKRPHKTAIMLLIDISASTDEQIAVSEKIINGSGFSDCENIFPIEKGLKNNKKIIDILRESLIVILEALNGLGEQVSVYGFSGQGRHQVDIYPFKELSEPLSDEVKSRVCNIAPKQSTRMGCAIRHAVGKFKKVESETRILILLSDGLPQDLDYGEDRTSKTYAINDTMMAFAEARREGIQPFCITVDNTGNDRLKFVSDPRRYLLIQDASCLPEVLPKIVESLIA